MNDAIDPRLNFCEIVNRSVTKHLEEWFGKSVLMTLSYHLSQEDVNVMKLCSCPEKFSDALERIFGAGGAIIELHCVQAAYRSFGLQVPNSCTSLKDALEDLRKSISQ
jgi:hypothetical protein